MHGGGGGGGSRGGADGGGGVGGGGGGTDSYLGGESCVVRGGGGVGGGGGGVGGVGSVGSGSSSGGSSSGVGGGGVGGVGCGSGGIGGADRGLGVASGGVGGGGGAVGNAGQERTRNQDGKRPQNPEGKPPSPSKVHAEKQWLQSAKATGAELEPEADRNALDDIVADTASAARSSIEVQAEVQVEVQAEWLELKERENAAAAQGISKGATLGLLPRIIIGGVRDNPKDEKQETQRDSTVGGEPSSIKAIQIASAQATSHGPSAPSPTSAFTHTRARTCRVLSPRPSPSS